MEQLLQAAGRVFASSGYDAASMNAIAREAGASPGTLYQFFPSKEAIAVELGRRYNHRLRETYSETFTAQNAMLPLHEMLDAVLDPMVAFCIDNPACAVLLRSANAPGAYVEEHDELHTALLTTIETLIALRAPDLPKSAATHATTMAIAIFTAGCDLVLRHEGTTRDAYHAELKRALAGYLGPLIGTHAPSR